MNKIFPRTPASECAIGPMIGTPRRAVPQPAIARTRAATTKQPTEVRISALPVAARHAPDDAAALDRRRTLVAHRHDAEIDDVERAAVGREAHRERPLEPARLQHRRRPVLLAGVDGELFDDAVGDVDAHDLEPDGAE